jgi:hypothetical protein
MDLSALRTVPPTPGTVAKYIASFFKREWTLDDYPIRFKEQHDTSPNNLTRLPLPQWVAMIRRWPGPVGTGSTKAEAYSALKKCFLTIKANPEPLPRPGTYRPIVFASSEKVDRFRELRDDFAQKVLNCDWAFMSDESSLWDFHSETDNEAMYFRIGEVYGVDVSHVSGAVIADILVEIMEQIRDFPEDSINKAIRLVRDARDSTT